MSGTKAKYNANNAETGMVVFKKAIRYVDNCRINEKR